MRMYNGVQDVFLPIILTVFFLSSSAFATDSPQGSRSGKPNIHVGFITNGVADFWTIARRGVRQAAEKYGVKVTIWQPASGVKEQNQLIRKMLEAKVNGVGISVINPQKQRALLQRVARDSVLVLHDVDVPDSNRACFIGVDNYVLGRTCGKLVKEAIPNGGVVSPHVGSIRPDTAKQRWQGLIDELLGRKRDPNRKVDPSKLIEGNRYLILPVNEDQFDRSKAHANADVVLQKHPELACMVGLFSYNVPACLKAIKSANKIGKVKIVGFDEDAKTLQGIKDGHIHATITQDPYQMGYKTIEILVALAQQQLNNVPQSKQVWIKAQIVRKKNVDVYWRTLKSYLD